jgi:hypothetical protein
MGIGRKAKSGIQDQAFGGYAGISLTTVVLIVYRLSFVSSAARLTIAPGDGKNIHRLILSASSLKHVAF